MRPTLSQCWYRGCPWLFALMPVSVLFGLLVRLRRWAYRVGVLKSTRLSVPVIVVGNITVGGAGKTPLVIWLARRLKEAGYRPGVISRGYGGSQKEPAAVSPDDLPALFGDEPVLMARRAECPVWVGRRRAQVGQCLLRARPEVDVILSDDGLQHYALGRDMELAVLDGDRGTGNGRLLPAGPLREPVARLHTVDAVVVNGPERSDMHAGEPTFIMRLIGREFYNVNDPELRVGSAHFAGTVATAVAGIGNPARFFSTLSDLGIAYRPVPFPDHHAYQETDLPQGAVIMTEKDAVKCTGFRRGDLWALAIDANVDEGLHRLIMDKLGRHHGQQVA